MKKPDTDYYQIVVDTQTDPDILKSELQDLIKEINKFCVELKKENTKIREKHFEDLRKLGA